MLTVTFRTWAPVVAGRTSRRHQRLAGRRRAPRVPRTAFVGAREALGALGVEAAPEGQLAGPGLGLEHLEVGVGEAGVGQRATQAARHDHRRLDSGPESRQTAHGPPQ